MPSLRSSSPQPRVADLTSPKKNLEDHLRKTYSDPLKEFPLPPMGGIPPLEEPETPFRAGGLRLYEAREFIRKARACSAPGLNGVSFKLYKNCPTVLEQLVCLLQRAWREGYVAQEWCLADGIWIPKEENIPNCMKEVTWLKLCLGTNGHRSAALEWLPFILPPVFVQAAVTRSH